MVVEVVLYFKLYKKYLTVFVTYRLDMRQLADCFTVAGGVHIQASEPATSHRLHRHVVLLTYLLKPVGDLPRLRSVSFDAFTLWVG